MPIPTSPLLLAAPAQPIALLPANVPVPNWRATSNAGGDPDSLSSLGKNWTHAQNAQRKFNEHIGWDALVAQARAERMAR